MKQMPQEFTVFLFLFANEISLGGPMARFEVTEPLIAQIDSSYKTPETEKDFSCDMEVFFLFIEPWKTELTQKKAGG